MERTSTSISAVALHNVKRGRTTRSGLPIWALDVLMRRDLTEGCKWFFSLRSPLVMAGGSEAQISIWAKRRGVRGGGTVGLRDVSRSDRVVSGLSAPTLSWESGPLFAINKTLREISHMWEPGCFLLRMSESSSLEKWSLSRMSYRWSTFQSIALTPPVPAGLHFPRASRDMRAMLFVFRC